MNYFEYLGQFLMMTRDPSLDGTLYLLSGVGDPHKKFRSVHVAGTNGKGSVVETLASALQTEKMRVGKFISPYITRFNEYMSINGVDITDAEIEMHLAKLKPIIESAPMEIKYFEIVTVLAFMHFAHHNVDIAVVEVGMGGTHDCTNVITPEVAVITQIHFDHKEVLGLTIEEIAGKKAGIIKQGVPVVTANTGESLEVIRRQAADMNSPLTIIDPALINVENLRIDKPMVVHFAGEKFKTTLRGRHQGVNTALAVEALRLLGMKKIKEFRVNHPARFDVISKKPLIIFDGAHNANSIAGFTAMVSDYFEPEIRKLLIVSMLSKKDPGEAMQQLALGLSPNTEIIFTGGVGDEFHKAETLQSSFAKFSEHPTLCAEFADALARADGTRAAFVVGSFKTFGAVKNFVYNRGKEDSIMIEIKDMGGMPFVMKIEDAVEQNTNYRKTIWTGESLQVTMMSIEPGEEMGVEVHPEHDQFYRIEKGEGLFQAGPARDKLNYAVPIKSDWAAMVPKGTWHNITNTGMRAIKLYTVYGPAHHPVGTIHATRADDQGHHDEAETV